MKWFTIAKGMVFLIGMTMSFNGHAYHAPSILLNQTETKRGSTANNLTEILHALEDIYLRFPINTLVNQNYYFSVTLDDNAIQAHRMESSCASDTEFVSITTEQLVLLWRGHFTTALNLLQTEMSEHQLYRLKHAIYGIFELLHHSLQGSEIFICSHFTLPPYSDGHTEWYVKITTQGSQTQWLLLEEGFPD